MNGIRNRALCKARINKRDEFYTRLCDIEDELRHYREHFEDQVVYCNCVYTREFNAKKLAYKTAKMIADHT
ncbi:adenine-specific methyltransferase EcoRI family protein [Candidatus Liberibacter sp.]|uniref:adenine-specific methyltransferase EcoRI family protein n=1 Tax=Candidatus Liberibacter sp. TaxID=34022 RepID=UPI0015F64149|nr:adenine-specific methyltransferase EcoRI family protein [Candidatus Liberibacter sp.]MBA5723675.1 hypothetical protein [Candidatus Liberibacter sp.]